MLHLMLCAARLRLTLMQLYSRSKFSIHCRQCSSRNANTMHSVPRQERVNNQDYFTSRPSSQRRSSQGSVCLSAEDTELAMCLSLLRNDPEPETFVEGDHSPAECCEVSTQALSLFSGVPSLSIVGSDALTISSPSALSLSSELLKLGDIFAPSAPSTPSDLFTSSDLFAPNDLFTSSALSASSALSTPSVQSTPSALSTPSTEHPSMILGRVNPDKPCTPMTACCEDSGAFEDRVIEGHSVPSIAKFQCSHESCLKRFATENRLNSHLAVHRMEKPFCCALCNASFKRASDRNRHILAKHTKHKSISCGLCRKKYSRKDALTRHLNGKDGNCYAFLRWHGLNVKDVVAGKKTKDEIDRLRRFYEAWH